MTTEANCRKFFADPSRNPNTGRTIKIGGPTYQQLSRDCARYGNSSPSISKPDSAPSSSMIPTPTISPLPFSPHGSVSSTSPLPFSPPGSVSSTSPLPFSPPGSVSSTSPVLSSLPHGSVSSTSPVLSSLPPPSVSNLIPRYSSPFSGVLKSKAASSIVSPFGVPMQPAPTPSIPIRSSPIHRDTIFNPIFTFSLQNLICSRFASLSEHQLLQNMQYCNPISAKIAASMIRVAVTRIFADPAQSIMEIPVNSIDSYRRLRAAEEGLPNPPSIGKFGMGFFSFLYWLIDHPDRFIRIYSIYQAIPWMVEIREIEGQLTGIFLDVTSIPSNGIDLSPPDQLPFYPLLQSGHGTAVGLFVSTAKDLLPTEDFGIHLNRLQFIPDITFDLNPRNNLGPTRANVTIILNDQEIVVVDGAEGMPIEILFNSLLVPTISTKTIQQSVIASAPFINTSRLVLLEESSGLIITVGDVVVVSGLKISQTNLGKIGGRGNSNENPTYLLTLPLNTPLPVSRDDVIITESTETLLVQSCLRIIDQCVSTGENLNLFFQYLRAYANYNRQPAIYRINRRVQDLTMARDDIIFLPNLNLVNILRPYLSFKIAYLENASMNRARTQLELALDEYEHRRKIEWNTRMIFKDFRIVPLPVKQFKPTTGEIGSYLFVGDDLLMDPTWQTRIAASFSDAILRNFDDPDPTIPGPVWREVRTIYSKKFNASRSTFDLMTPFLSDLNGLYAMIEAKFMGWGPNVTIMVKHRYSDSARQIKQIFVDSLAGVGILLRLTSDPSIIQEYIGQLRLLISTFKLLTTYGGQHYIEFIPTDDPKFNRIHPGPEVDKTIEGLFHSIQVARANMDIRFSWIDERDFPDIPIADLPTGWEKILLPRIQSQMRTGFEGYVTVNIISSFLHLPSSAGITVNFFSAELITYLFQEIRSRYDANFLAEWRARRFWRIDEQFEHVFYRPMVSVLVLMQQAGRSNLTGQCPEIVLPPETITISATQLIDYVFATADVRIEDDLDHRSLIQLLQQVSHHRLHLESGRPQFQSIEIAVNEGTTKPFVASILSELTQNSVDAIRDALASGRSVQERIDITVCDRIRGDAVESIELIFRDYVGIPDSALLSLWIPFLSNKSATDLMSTGEMGTGFFNVYRQPWVHDVIIQSRDLIIYARPILIRDRVTDIQYTVGTSDRIDGIISNSLGNNSGRSRIDGTQITIRMNSMSLPEIIERKIDLSIFANSILPFVNFPVYVNGFDVGTTFEIFYETEVGRAAMITGRNAPSILLTNGIPMTELGPYLKTIFYSINPELEMGLIIDLNKGWYRPTQSRNKLGPGSKALTRFLSDCLFQGIMYKLLRNPDSNFIQKMLPQVDSIAPLNQFRGWSGIGSGNHLYDNLTFPTYYGLVKLATTSFNFDQPTKPRSQFFTPLSSETKFEDRLSIAEGIRFLILAYSNSSLPISQSQTEKYLDMILDPMEINGRRIILNWMQLKTNSPDETPGTPEQEEQKKNLLDQARVELIPTQNLLQHFVNLYYEIGRRVDITQGVDFTRPPSVEFADLGTSVLGGYINILHRIEFNAEKWRSTQAPLLSNLHQLKSMYQRDPVAAIRFFRTNTVLRHTFGNTHPATTLIHELLHALHRSTHGDAKDVHGSASYVVDGVESRLEFDDACVMIYDRILAAGFLDRFILMIP